ncbi:hypothetical protein MJO28_014248 [Puccinia striiformis f. sp. tritici]|uniref:Uncharacterized protein n=1 Tax=Puccinia striiformis f. sp. tritici TaxID=168172 RepID=A0ACC0DUH3_9BASI|nr:hypothetical protein MJO28_017801 [Puccinia striiformis f. sp. tritici]KAI7938669.1 hypothetical protein MJO28_014248 [Puccinia striiformis f. sp. tritici]KAI7956217.1 hypothetical protein MJO29_007616 [Puccinia striiformis f. sp. tritici]
MSHMTLNCMKKNWIHNHCHHLRRGRKVLHDHELQHYNIEEGQEDVPHDIELYEEEQESKPSTSNKAGKRGPA